jgi:hypothetical protein
MCWRQRGADANTPARPVNTHLNWEKQRAILMFTPGVSWHWSGGFQLMYREGMYSYGARINESL